MGTAAQFERTPRLEHPDDISVLVAEERDCTFLGGCLLAHLVRSDSTVGDDLRIGQLFDTANLCGGDRFVVTEVEP